MGFIPNIENATFYAIDENGEYHPVFHLDKARISYMDYGDGTGYISTESGEMVEFEVLPPIDELRLK